MAAHHAGLLPAFKETVEELFVRGLVKAVFATETLALGINMPARCVVLERLVKFNGEAHVDLTPGEYTQLTGRAGRRGIDVEGHAVVVWSPGGRPAARRRAGLDPDLPAAVVVPAVVQHGRQPGRHGRRGRRRASCWSRSFAQFQADRSVVGLARQVHAQRARRMAGVRGRDALPPRRLRRVLRAAGRRSPSGRRRWPGRAPRQRRAAAVAVAGAAAARRRDPGAVRAAGPGWRSCSTRASAGFGEPRPLVLTEDRWAGRSAPVDFPTPVERARPGPGAQALQPPLARRPAATWPPTLRNAAGRRTRRAGAGGRAAGRRRRPELAQLRAASCASTRATRCPDREEHARWAERRARLQRDTDGAARARSASRTGSLARTFDQVCALLTDRGYLAGSGDAGEVTDAGRHAGPDLDRGRPAGRRVPAAPASGTGSTAAELAAAVSVVVYEARREAEARRRLPRGPGRAARSRRPGGCGPSSRTTRQRARAAADPRAGPRLRLGRSYRWARGEPLDRVLASPRTAGHGAVRPATSSAGRGSCSTCSTSSPRSAAPSWPGPRGPRWPRCAGAWWPRPVRSSPCRTV